MSKQNKDELLRGWKREIEGIIMKSGNVNEHDEYFFTEYSIDKLSSSIIDYIQELFNDPEIVEAMASKILESDVNTGTESADS
jgi:hypothetical protein